MVLADLCLATERRLNAMEQQKVTINELVKRLTDEMLRIGYSKQTSQQPPVQLVVWY